MSRWRISPTLNGILFAASCSGLGIDLSLGATSSKRSFSGGSSQHGWETTRTRAMRHGKAGYHRTLYFVGAVVLLGLEERSAGCTA